MRLGVAGRAAPVVVERAVDVTFLPRVVVVIGVVLVRPGVSWADLVVVVVRAAGIVKSLGAAALVM